MSRMVRYNHFDPPERQIAVVEPVRTSFAHSTISAGDIKSAPQAPSPPALATAIDSAGALAPAIGANRMGTRSPNRLQNSSVRSRMFMVCLASIATTGLRAQDHDLPSFKSLDRREGDWRSGKAVTYEERLWPDRTNSLLFPCSRISWTCARGV